MLNNLVQFLPAASIFYFISILLPIVLLLFTFGNIVYTVGELKERDIATPRVLLQLIFAAIAIFTIFYGCLNLILAKSSLSFGVEAIVLMLYGLFISIESIIVNRMLFKVNSFICKKLIRSTNAADRIKKIISSTSCSSKVAGFTSTVLLFIIAIGTVAAIVVGDDIVWWIALSLTLCYFCYAKAAFLSAVYKPNK